MGFEEGWPKVEAARGRHNRKEYVEWYQFADFSDVFDAWR